MTSRCRALRPRAFVLVLALAAACGHDESTAPPVVTGEIAGHWSGSAEFGVQFSADFTREGTNVGGSGSFTSPVGSGPFTVTGGHVNGADVILDISSPEFGTATYTGRFTTADRITGRLTAPSFGQIVLTLDRGRG
jgi:hypothetical protein